MRNKIIKTGVAALALCLCQNAFADGSYTIYPVPQQQLLSSTTVRLTSKVNVIIESGIDQATRNRLMDVLSEHHIEAVTADQPSTTLSNIYLGINGSNEQADLYATQQNFSKRVFHKRDKYDRHIVCLSGQDQLAQILILGENTDASFFGIASLEQMLEADHNAMPCVKIYDYADQKSRGIVEGYYGYPYTVQVKKDLMRYMMRYKMNTYLYGAKSDPYHSQYWKQPYPESLTAQQVKNGWLSQDMVREITGISHSTKVNFIWAIHPGNDIINSTSVVDDVLSKFDMMYQLGVRQFAVFVDDVGVPSKDADMKLNAENITKIQNGIEKRYNTQYETAADTVKPLHFVPQIYCSSWVGEQQRKRFFNALSALPPQVTLYTTGWGVWSVPNQNDFNLTASEFGRPAAWWWNYPCNDNADAQVYPMDMYSNFYDMPAVNDKATLPTELYNGQGIVCNPMQQGEISKIPLFSTADYSWNTSGFDNNGSWNAAFPAIVGKEKAKDLQTVAQYLRRNDADELGTLIGNYQYSLENGTPDITAVKAKLDEVHAACLSIEELKNSARESDRLLYADMAPWLLKLKQMTASASHLVETSALDKASDAKWEKYVAEVQPVNALDTAEMYKAYALEGMGNSISVSVRQAAAAQKHLYPFTQYLKDHALGNYFTRSYKEFTLISNVSNMEGKVVVRNDSVGLSDRIYTLGKGEYVGLALPSPRKLQDVTVADTLLNGLAVLYSTNGKIWNDFTGKEEFLDGYVKYLCVKNDGKETRDLRLTMDNFSVIFGEATKVDFVTLPDGPIWNEGGYLHGKDLLVDGDYSTYTCLYRCQQSGDTYKIELNKVTPVHDVRICMGTTNGDHMGSGYVEVSKDGKQWTKIPVKGSTVYDFTINMPQAVKFSNEMTYCDFDGNGIEGKYVRFCLKSAKTDKWLRFYEIEVNKQHESVVESATIPNGPIWQNHKKEFIYDGVPTSFVCLNQCQKAGDKYTLKLKEPTKVNEVRVYMGNTNGDHMNKGNIEVSANGTTWEKLYVKGTGTYDFTMDMPQTHKYADAIYYCDFTAKGTAVSYVRFVVTDPRTDKWLRLYEIQVNPNDSRDKAECMGQNGSAITTLDDALPYTGIHHVDQSLTYFFNGINLLKSVVIYQDASQPGARQTTVKVTSDGEHWTDHGTLSQSKQTIDLSQQGDAVAMKLEWKGDNSPAIYEIVPLVDDLKFAEVTKIEQVTATGENVDFSFNGRTITISAACGIDRVDVFTPDGKAVMHYEAAEAERVQLPTLFSSKQTYIVRVALGNGETATSKIYCR